MPSNYMHISFLLYLEIYMANPPFFEGPLAETWHILKHPPPFQNLIW